MAARPPAEQPAKIYRKRPVHEQFHPVARIHQREAEPRDEIDAKLTAAGWAVQDNKHIDPFEKLGVAVRGMDAGCGPSSNTGPRCESP